MQKPTYVIVNSPASSTMFSASESRKSCVFILCSAVEWQYTVRCVYGMTLTTVFNVAIQFQNMPTQDWLFYLHYFFWNKFSLCLYQYQNLKSEALGLIHHPLDNSNNEITTFLQKVSQWQVLQTFLKYQ